MKFLKPVLIILAFVALTYTVSASKVSFNKLSSKSIAAAPSHSTPTGLPVNGDLIFAFTAIATLGGYMVFKK